MKIYQHSRKRREQNPDPYVKSQHIRGTSLYATEATTMRHFRWQYRLLRTHGIDEWTARAVVFDGLFYGGLHEVALINHRTQERRAS